MWLFTRFGFFSAVCARVGDGKKSRAVDPTRMMIRARDRQHLENLIEAFPLELLDAEIHQRKPGSTGDYVCRIFVPKSVWVEVVTSMVEAQNYDNFKVACSHSKADGAYLNLLHKVWICGMSLQKAKHQVGYEGQRISLEELAEIAIRSVRDDMRESLWAADMRAGGRKEAQEEIAQALRDAGCPKSRVELGAERLTADLFTPRKTKKA